MPSRADVVAEALSWVDVPYLERGRSRQGVDCIGLPIKVAHALGLSSYENTNYGGNPQPANFVREVRRRMQAVPARIVGNGDIGLFREPSHPTHCGIIEIDELGQRWVIHAAQQREKVVREPLVGLMLERLMLAFQYPGLED